MPATVKVKYSRDLRLARFAVHYHAFRSRELPNEQRGAFNRASDHADCRTFVRRLDDPLTRDYEVRRRGRPRQGGPSRTIRPAKLHRIIFSLSRAEWEKSGLTSWKPIVREVLAEWERLHGIRLDWIAAEHMSHTHPHVHIDVKSVYWDVHGRKHRLRFDRQMIDELRWAVRGVVRRERERHWRELQQQRAIEWAERQAARDLAHNLSHLATSFLDGLERAARQDEREAEWLQPRRYRRRRSPRRPGR